MAGNTEEALGVLREIWNAQGQTAQDVEDACGTGKSCQKMSDVGFDGLAERNGLPERNGVAQRNGVAEPDGADLRAAWRTQLAREGKLNPAATTVRDLVLPAAETGR